MSTFSSIIQYVYPDIQNIYLTLFPPVCGSTAVYVSNEDSHVTVLRPFATDDPQSETVCPFHYVHLTNLSFL